MGIYPLILSGIFFGVILAGYLWGVLGVRSPAKVGVVVVTGAGAFLIAGFAMILVGIGQITHHSGPLADLILRFVIAGTVGGGLVSMGFLVSLPGPREATRVVAEMLLCAVAGGLLGAAAAMLEDPLHPSLSQLPLGAVWQAGMGVVLALIADATKDT